MGKVSALSAFVPVGTDLLYGVDDPGGTPISGQHTYDVLDTYLAGTTKTLANKTLTGLLGVVGAAVLNSATGNEIAWDLSYTTNKATSGNDTGIFLDWTNTASPGTSLLMDLQVAASSVFNVAPAGDTTLASAAFLAWSTDLFLFRDAANTLALRNGTTAQGLRIYNTWDTGGTNFERASIYFTGNEFTIDSESGGTGLARNIKIKVGNGTKLLITSYIEANANFQPDGNSNRDLGTTSSGWRDLFVAGSVHTKDAGALTIATGVVTVTGSYHTIDTQSAASSDDLDTINGGVDGAHLVLQADNTARTVNVTRAGNIKTSADPVPLADTESTITLIYSGALSAWVEIANSTNV